MFVCENCNGAAEYADLLCLACSDKLGGDVSSRLVTSAMAAAGAHVIASEDHYELAELAEQVFLVMLSAQDTKGSRWVWTKPAPQA